MVQLLHTGFVTFIYEIFEFICHGCISNYIKGLLGTFCIKLQDYVHYIPSL